MEYSIFNSLIWKTKINYNEKEQLIKIIENNYLKNPNQTPKGWGCTLHTSFKQKNRYIPKDLIKIFEDKCNEFLDLYEKKLKISGNYYLQDYWYNAYKGNQFQEPHTHGTSLFSGCYYLKFNKEYCHQTEFYNPNFNLDYSKLEGNDYFCFNLDCEEDDLIIFPSFLKHGTKGIKNKKEYDDLRITITFNVTNSNICYSDNFKQSLSYH